MTARPSEQWYRVLVYRGGPEPEEHKGVDFDFEVRDGGALYVGRREYEMVQAEVAYAPGFWCKVTIEEIEG